MVNDSKGSNDSKDFSMIGSSHGCGTPDPDPRGWATEVHHNPCRCSPVLMGADGS